MDDTQLLTLAGVLVATMFGLLTAVLGWIGTITLNGKPVQATESKMVSFTRDMAAASGTVSVTGVGFQPTKITFLWGVDGAVYHGSGVAAGTQGAYSCVYAAGLTFTDLGLISIMQMTTDQSTYQYGVVTATADGFDVAWVKAGAPTGTLGLKAICER